MSRLKILEKDGQTSLRLKELWQPTLSTDEEFEGEDSLPRPSSMKPLLLCPLTAPVDEGFDEGKDPNSTSPWPDN